MDWSCPKGIGTRGLENMFWDKGFVRGDVDHRVYCEHESNHLIIFILYGDDIVLIVDSK